MKNFRIIAILVVAFATQSSAQLLISGVIDGPLSGGLPKAVEFHAKEDIADLSIFGFGAANNGGGTDGQEYSFPAISLAAGEKYCVASESTEFTNWFGSAPDDTDNTSNINGDDAIELFKNGTVIDVFGDIDVDGNGEPWEYLDGWAYRANSLAADGTFALGDWMFSGANALDGETSNGTAAVPFPLRTLPVELISFKAQKIVGAVQLTWETAMEINNHQFEIERSFDGKYFDRIGKVEGNGDSQKNIAYHFEDRSAANGVNYYRLKQVDLDGQFEYSPIISANYNSVKVKVAPTKTDNLFTVEIANGYNASIAVYDLSGQILMTYLNVESQQVIDISTFASGTYLVSIVTNGQVQTEKILKL